MGMSLWAVGRNYEDHAKEMQAEKPASPLIFLKASSCLSRSKKIILPNFSQSIHHEIEVAIQLSENLQPLQIALALDLTARDIQSQAKQKGLPWALAKSFKGSCPMGPWIPYQNQEWFDSLNFELLVNGEKRQAGKTSDMIFSITEILKHLQAHFPLLPGDIVLTGTPAGVGPLRSGDQLLSRLMGKDYQSWLVEEDR